MLFVSCTKEEDEKPTNSSTSSLFDVIPPRIRLNEPESNFTVFGSVYVDPGVTVVDNCDDNPEIKVSGQIDEHYAGKQTITYTATDDRGNTSSLDRKVTVDAASYLTGNDGNAFYSVDDSDPYVPVYTDEISVSSSAFNKVFFSMFAWFENATVYAEFSGANSIVIPEQVVNCGNDNVDRKFTGTGTFTASSMTISYTVANADGSGEFSGSATYTKQ